MKPGPWAWAGDSLSSGSALKHPRSAPTNRWAGVANKCYVHASCVELEVPVALGGPVPLSLNGLWGTSPARVCLPRRALGTGSV